MLLKTRQVLHECVIILKCESAFTVTQLHHLIKNASEIYKAFSRRFQVIDPDFPGKAKFKPA